MPTWNFAESPGAQLELVPRVVATQLGDGYEQRSDDGLNPVQQVWNIPFRGVDAAVANDMEAFLKPGLGRASFDYTPPRQTVALKFKCTSFRRVMTDQVGIDDIDVRFEQVFEP